MRTLLLAFGFCLVALPAQATALRPYVSLTSSSVRLSDLFSGLTPDQDQVIGPSPTPGNRIVVGADQLQAIAGEFGVDWQSASPADHVILERAGVPMPTQPLTDALKAALAGRGAPAQSEISLLNYTPPEIAPNDSVTPLVGSVAYDPATGSFSALVTIAGPATPEFTLRVAGTAAEVAQIPVLTRLLATGEAISADDVKLVTMRVPQNAAGIARSANQVVGQALRHIVPAGAPLPLSELAAPQAVAANALVEMELDAGGLTLQGRGIAEQAGSVGDMIRVRNPESLAVMLAEIVGPNQVRVDPNSQPIVMPHTDQEYAAR